MNTIFTIVAILGILIFAAIGRFRVEKDRKTEDTTKEKLEINIIEEDFFERVSAGEVRVSFLKIDSQFDLMFIKSLFQHEQIPYYVEFEHISSIRPGMAVGDLGNYNLLYILRHDYKDALKVVHNYLENKAKVFNLKAEKGRHLIEIFFTNWKIFSASDMGGLRISYQNKDEGIRFREKIKKIIEGRRIKG
jgi:hypothetical protein